MNTKNPGPSLPLHFRKYGDPAAPKLIILHGLFGAGVNWRSIAARLAASHEVFCPDLRNHGQSPWHEQMGYADMAGDVARFIAEQELHRPALLGHSMGGKIAMVLAQARRIELARLVVVDIAPVAYRPDRHLELIDAMCALNVDAADRKEIDAALAARIPDQATRQFLAQNLRKDGERYCWRLNLAAIRQHMAALAAYGYDGESAVDALFIAGANSDYLRPAAHGEIRRRFPNARFETVENAGHWLHAEQPERFVALCGAFLAG